MQKDISSPIPTQYRSLLSRLFLGQDAFKNYHNTLAQCVYACRHTIIIHTLCTCVYICVVHINVIDFMLTDKRRKMKI